MRPRAVNQQSHDARSLASVKLPILGRGAALDGLTSQGANADAIGRTTDRVDQRSAIRRRQAGNARRQLLEFLILRLRMSAAVMRPLMFVPFLSAVLKS
jgi:hypothetical protein